MMFAKAQLGRHAKIRVDLFERFANEVFLKIFSPIQSGITLRKEPRPRGAKAR